MKAIRIAAHGGPEVLDYADHELAPLGADEVRIRHTAIGLNFVDTYQRSGLYPMNLPTGLGLEAAGVVEAIGDRVSRFKIGDRVAYGNGPPGAYAEAANVPAGRAVKLPDGIPDDVGAAAMLKGLTVFYLLTKTYAVQRGQTILFHAAAGGVGTIACAWAKHLGATVIGTVGSDDKAAVARAHGCDHPIVYTREDFVARTRELTGGAGVPVVYDSVGGDTLEKSLDCLSRRGLLVAFGNASGAPKPLNLLLLSQKGSLYVTRPTAAHYFMTTEELDEGAAALFEVIETGAVKIEINQRYALADAAEAHRALESRQTTGATVLFP
jgi:NADPH2:quinone reductase